MLDLVPGTDEATWRDARLRAALVDTLEYQVNTLEMLAAYRADGAAPRPVARHRLRRGARAAWSTARDRFDAAAASHEAAYRGNVALPAYNLTARRIGEERAVRDLPMAWAARRACSCCSGGSFAG